jgi:hypothetical protein
MGAATAVSNTSTIAGVERDCQILFTVHGVNSDSDKLARLQDRCRARIDGLAVEHCNWQNMKPWRLVDDATATLVKNYVRERLHNTFYRHSHSGQIKLTVVAHSYGTLAVLRVMQDHLPGFQINSLVLLGSIIPRTQQWDGFIDSRQLEQPPVAIIRPFDWIVRLSKVYYGQPSGALGFVPQGLHTPLEIFKHGGHNAYYPDDCDDVIQVVKEGPAGVTAVSREDWARALTRRSRLHLWLLSRVAPIVGWILALLRGALPGR